jgi:hypothetical protein
MFANSGATPNLSNNRLLQLLYLATLETTKTQPFLFKFCDARKL